MAEINHFLVLLYRAYDLQLSDAMNDLQEQVKVEHAPTDKNEHGVEVSFTPFSHTIVAYIYFFTCPFKSSQFYSIRIRSS